MVRRGGGVRRSAADWLVRGLSTVAVLSGGYVAVAQALSASLRSRDPERAVAIAPWDGRASANWARKMAGVEANSADRLRADAMSRHALRQDPTTQTAASTLGMNAQIRGETETARRLLAYAQTLSRRDLPTQIWALEDAVARDDVAGALKHYDIALRTSRRAPDILFPVLRSAISDPVVRSALVKVLASGSSWASAFTDYIAGSGPDPQATASLFLALRRVGIPVSEGASGEVLNLLISKNLLADAWSFYALIRPGVVRHTARDPRFTAGLVSPTPLDWMPSADPTIAASIQRGDKGGAFDFALPATIGGPLLQQMQMLPTGEYRLAGHSEEIDQPDNSRPYWVLTCQDGRELGRVAVPNSAEANGAFTGRFTVPTDCPVQTLALVARPSDRVAGVTGRIDLVQLSRTR